MISGAFLLEFAMHVITTAREAVCLCAQPIDPEFSKLIGRYAAVMEEFGHDLKVMVLVVEAGDSATLIHDVCGYPVIAEERFTFPVEVIARHRHWLEVVWITTDSGDGLVLLIDSENCRDAGLMAACDAALAEASR